ncbi:MAG: hypothetical protein VX899_06650 [Myxococcota bacterium]|nr:hypothetical protein [Myxococcota bacterium]
MKRTLPALTLMLALWGLPGVAQAGDLSPFFESEFDYCDAKVLAAFWGEDLSQAKATISQKLTAGGPEVVHFALKMAQERALQAGNPTCSVYEMGYTVADAEALAQNWGYTTQEAKAAMFNKYLNVGEKGLVEALKASNAPTVMKPPAAPPPAQDGPKMQYCDAKVVAAMWGIDVTTAKASLQGKLDGGRRDLFDEALHDAYARPDAPSCDWTEVRYQYEDAVVLSQLWGMSLQDTKAQIAKKVSAGNSEVVDQMLMAAMANPQ